MIAISEETYSEMPFVKRDYYRLCKDGKYRLKQYYLPHKEHNLLDEYRRYYHFVDGLYKLKG